MWNGEMKDRTAIDRRSAGHCGEESAGKEEILGFLTGLMRDKKAADVKTRMRAAEILGKRAGAFDKEGAEEQQERVVIVDDIP